MIQGSEEWLSWRSGGIGGSDVAAIMGVSEWDTPYSVWLVKTKRKQPKDKNWAMERGTEGEAKIRALYELRTGLDVPPACVEHSEHSYLRVSLDGYSAAESLVVEMKYLGKEKHELAQRGLVPECYIPQLQYQMAVTGAGRAHYVSYSEGELEVVVVPRDDAYIDAMLPKVQAFWELVLTDTAPELTERDYLDANDLTTVEAFENWKREKLMMLQLEEILEQVKSAHKEREQKLDAARSVVEGLMRHPKMRAAGVKASMVKRKNGQSLTLSLEGL